MLQHVQNRGYSRIIAPLMGPFPIELHTKQVYCLIMQISKKKKEKEKKTGPLIGLYSVICFGNMCMCFIFKRLLTLENTGTPCIKLEGAYGLLKCVIKSGPICHSRLFEPML